MLIQELIFFFVRAELNIRPWETTLNNIQEGNKLVKWKDRVPYAFWKGNPEVSKIRKELIKCNTSDQHDWNARIYNVVSILNLWLLFQVIALIF